jgi:Domain of unknown function (DUF1707)
VRIGDTEREAALKALGTHLSVGRLNADEYGERAARATAAKTRADLTQLFTDLPQPHPALDQLPDTASQDGTSNKDRAVAARRGTRQRLSIQPAIGALVPLSAILAVVLFFSINGLSWTIFLLPVAVAVIIGALSSR